MQDNKTSGGGHAGPVPNLVPGPPFVFGAFMVIIALMVSAFIPDGPASTKSRRQSGKIKFYF